MFYDPAWAIPHLISIAIALAFVVAAIVKPLLARKLYAGLFLYATLVNASVAFLVPQSYVGNARYALSESYRAFILGWFAQHVTLAVLAISCGQALVAAGLIRGGWAARVSLVGALAFLLAIAPLGVGSAFPSSLIWAFGAGWLLFHARGQAALEGSLSDHYRQAQTHSHDASSLRGGRT
jgi:hypothetical protein